MYYIGDLQTYIIIIVVLFLGDKHHKDWTASHEHGIIEGIARRVSPQVNLRFFARIVLLGIIPDAYVVLAIHIDLTNSKRRHGMVDTRVGHNILVLILSQVEGLAYLAALKQRCITFAVDIGHFVLHWQHGYTVLARHGTGFDDQPVAVGIHVAGVKQVFAEIVVAMQLCDTGVQLVAHQIGGIVPLQLHDDGQRVAQVVH